MAVLVTLAACGASFESLARPAPESLPAYSPLRTSSLSLGDAWLRHHLMVGEPREALELLADDRSIIRDPLLRTLQEAIVRRQAGEYVRSNELLEWADLETERRRVRSVSRTAASFLVNDGTLSYTPRAAEAAMIPYYRAMNYLAMDDVDAAAVEARRITAILDQSGIAPVRSCNEDGMLHYVTALVFELAGETNDALVSLRKAVASFDSCAGNLPVEVGEDLYRLATAMRFDQLADSILTRLPAPPSSTTEASGELIVLVEQGFIAHRRESAIHVPIFPEEIEALEEGGGDAIPSVVAIIAGRLLSDSHERSYWGSAWNDHPAVQVGQALGGAHILRLAWPTIEVPLPMSGVTRLVAGASSVDVRPIGNLSIVAEQEVIEDRPVMTTRLVTRGVIKYLASRELEKKAEKEGGEFLGFVAGRLANLAANELERPDTRSWSLLPDRIGLARIVLPPGNHELRLELLSPAGTRLGSVHLGRITMEAGSRTVISHRIWPERDLFESVSGTTRS